MFDKKTIIDLFSEQVTKIPDHVAIIFQDQQLSYKELDNRSNQLAHYLQNHGIKKETLVPICISNPLEMVVGILGILKAGAAYVPVDPEFPADRIRYMIEDTAAEVVLSDSPSSRFLSAAEGKTIILTDQHQNEISSMSVENVDINISPDNIIYVIYTSGSTGKPKGVLIEHHCMVDYVNGLYKHVPLSVCKSYALGTSMATDQGNTNLYSSLVFGGALHLFSKENFNDVEYIHQYFNTRQIDCLKLVPSHWKSLSLNGKDLLPDKLLIIGGEALHTTVIHDYLNNAQNGFTLVNHYGPTETTIGSLLHVVDPANTYHHTIPIGKPFSDEQVYLLAADLTEVKEGETGEIYIGGAGVARGYLNRPELTEERFVKDIFSDKPNARLYRTGDLARKLPDGNIQYLGRIDDQVKINGYRIELGEIESTLQNAPGVKQGVVMVRENSNGDKRLMGYVICPEYYDKHAITDFLNDKLPAYMVPQLFMQVDSFPFLPNGKVNKKLLPDPDVSSLLTNAYYAPNYKTEAQITEIWKEILEVKRVGIEDNFFELGGTSLLSQKFVALLKTRYQLNLPVTKIYQFPRIKDLAAFLDGRKPNKSAAKNKRTASAGQNTEVAIIGMAGRFPGANSVEALWDVLKKGKETTRFFTDDELDSNIPDSLKNNPDYVKARGIVEDVQSFDAAFFGITPKLAELMDPQQRIFLQIAWEALEKTGYTNAQQDTTIGVFAGVGHNTYYEHNVLSNPALIENVGKTQLITVTAKDYISSRTAYALDLKGPAVTVQSACSTSLLAVAQAVQSIRSGQCDMALAGGATIDSPVNSGHLYEEGAMLSSDGHCRPFDADATGTVFSDGAGVILLKNKEQAIKDGDYIFAVIKGIGVNSDGGDKGSFTAPSAEGQADVIRMAIDDANVNPADISYVETHGTATPLGDPIEIEGLNIAFGPQSKNQFCGIGSVKSNFGHLTCAAGITGLIKAGLAMHHKQLPASINFKKANPNIDFEHSPFKVNDTLTSWDSANRIAGVSSFGVGGTNVHVIIAAHENIPQISVASPRPVQLLTGSAKNEQSLDGFAEKLADYVIDTDNSLADVAYTLNVFRQPFNYRRFVLFKDNTDLAEQLKNPLSLTAQTKKNTANIREVVFMFPGQGSQFLNMGKDLYLHEPVFKNAMDECNGLLKSQLHENLVDIIYPELSNTAAEEKLNNTKYSQPALFAVGYSLAKLWMSWGVYPSAFIGHSIGEFLAAHMAGVFSLQDTLKIIATRGQLMSELPGGDMLSVREKAETLLPLLPADISIAAINSPGLCVVAGTSEAIAKFSQLLDEKQIASRLLHTSHAFHSYMMDEVVEPFKQTLSTVKFQAPLIPIYSTVTGEKLQNEEATNPEYWANHLRSTVQFEQAARKLLEEHQEKAFLELGPGNATATFIRQQPAGKNSIVLSSLEMPPKDESAYQSVFKALGQLWTNGFELDWQSFYKEEKRIKLNNLPTYAFNKTKYWVYPAQSTTTTTTTTNTNQSDNHPLIQTTPLMRKPILISQIKDILESTSGIEMQDASSVISFIEMGLDSLLLTQIAIALKKNFNLPITFRQLNEEYSTLDKLADYIDAQLPPETITTTVQPIAITSGSGQQPTLNNFVPANYTQGTGTAIDLISQQLQLLAQQLSLIQGQGTVAPSSAKINIPAATNGVVQTQYKTPDLSPEELIEIKKPFGASPRIDKQSATLSPSQQEYLSDLTKRYTEQTKRSKAYTQENRAHMADPRVVSGFKPATKELVYSIVINKSKGSRFWDLDGNEYIDALNGFGSNMLGYQPNVIKKALIDQIEKGYEIGPQHELSGEVSKLICEFTDFDRAALCNTGSEAVLGAMRIARTVTGRSLIVAFTGSYHGIVDEVIVRGSKKHKSFPAASGIMPESVQNMLILDYGTEESLNIIKERAHELAAVLVEPLQSRRPDFLPVEFLKEVRTITENSGTALIFDEVISGFRFHPRGIQGMYGIKADIGTYGKVAGAGISIGIIAGTRNFMDALDGGFWQFGDDSVPEAGVTYFAGTFVRHPLALATAKASLTYLREMGPGLQENLNANGLYIAAKINAICQKLRVPIFIAQFGSLWRIRFIEEYPYTELFFTLMRLKGIHILEGFSCFLTTEHSSADIDQIISCFEESLIELKEVGFIPDYAHAEVADSELNSHLSLNTPPVPNARLGKDQAGNPAWFIKDEKNPGKYLQVN